MTKRLLILKNINDKLSVKKSLGQEISSVREACQALWSTIEYANININHTASLSDNIAAKSVVSLVTLSNTLIANIYFKYQSHCTDYKKADQPGDIIHYYQTTYFSGFKNLDLSLSGNLTVQGFGGMFYDKASNSVEIGGLGLSRMVYDGDFTMMVKSVPIYFKLNALAVNLEISADYQSRIYSSGSVMIDGQEYQAKDLMEF